MRVLMAVTLALLLVPAFGGPAAAGTQEETYNVPASFVIRDTFGFGVLLCADERVPDLATETVRNGPCFDYGGLEGEPYTLSAHDAAWAHTSITVAVDLNGDGCVSDSCQGVPNDADYRVTNCGPITDTLPETNGGPTVLQVFLRAIDIAPNLGICGATHGKVFFATD